MRQQRQRDLLALSTTIALFASLSGACERSSTAPTQFEVAPGSYRLLIGLVGDECGPHGPAEMPRQYPFDGTLHLIDNRLKFATSPPPPQYTESQIVVDVTRSGDSVSGGIVGRSLALTRNWLSVWAIGAKGPFPPGTITGAVVGPSSLAGTFDAELLILHSTYGIDAECAGTHMWTLVRQ